MHVRMSLAVTRTIIFGRELEKRSISLVCRGHGNFWRQHWVRGSGRRDWRFTARTRHAPPENGDDSVPRATRVAVRAALSRCHALVRVVACRPQPREDPEGLRTAGRRFRHVPTGAAILTADEGGARLEISQGMRSPSTVPSKISPRGGCWREVEWRVTTVTWTLTRPRAREWAYA